MGDIWAKVSRRLSMPISRIGGVRFALLLCLVVGANATLHADQSLPNPSLSLDYVSGNNQSGAPNTVLAQALAVDVWTAYSQSQEASVTWSVLNGSATIQENRGISYTDDFQFPDNGAAEYFTSSIHITLGATSGPVLVRAYCGACASFGGTAVQDFDLTIVQPMLQIVAGNDQTGLAATAAAEPLVVQLSANGTPVAGQTVSWAVASGQATLSAASAVTDSNGHASIDLTFGANAGPVMIQASVPGSQVVFNATASVPDIAAISGDGQSGPENTMSDAPLVVRVSDSSGKPLPGQTVLWSVNSGPAIPGRTSSVTDSSGNASIDYNFGASPGTSTIQASAGTANVNFTSTTYVAALSAISGVSQTGIVGTTLEPFTVQIGPPGGSLSHPASSNPASLAQIQVTWSVMQGGGTLVTTQTFSDANGRTTNTLTLGPTPGPNIVRASLANGDSVDFTAIAVPAISAGSSVFAIVSGNSQALVPGQASQPLVIKLTASNGSPITNAGIQWGVTGATGQLASSSTTTGADGTAKNTLTVVLPGSYTVTAQVADVPGLPILTFTFTNGVADLPGLSPAQIGVAGAIDKACPALATSTTPLTPAQKDFLQRCSELVVGSGSNPQQVPGALNAMLNNKVLPQDQLASSVQLSQSSNLNTRMGELRQGAQGFSVRGLTFANDGQSLPLAMLGNLFRKDPQAGEEIGKDFDRWGFFATGMIDRGGYSANAGRPGFDYHNASITAGVDYRFTDAFVAGVAMGYNSNNSTIDQSLGKIDVSSYSLNGYFTWYHNDDFYLEGSAVFAWLDYDLSRNIAYQIANLSGNGVSTINQTMSASPDGHQSSLSLSLGKDFNRGAWAMSPYLRGVYTHMNLGGFSESPDDPNAPGAGLATSVNSRSLSSMLGIVGGRLSYTTSFDWGVLVPNATLEWNHEFRNDPQVVVTRFLADPTQTPIVITDQAPDQDYFNFGLGLNALFPKGRSGYVTWEHLVGYTGAHDNRFSLGIRIEF